MQYTFVSRKEFVESRYQRFLKNKETLTQIDPDYRFFRLTDLDLYSTTYQRPLKEVVLCDRCQDNIESLELVLVERNLCYHETCLTPEDDWFEPRPVLPPNVVRLPGGR